MVSAAIFIQHGKCLNLSPNGVSLDSVTVIMILVRDFGTRFLTKYMQTVRTQKGQPSVCSVCDCRDNL